MNTTLHLFDDGVARRWEPMALTRPGGSLLFGTLRMWERGERALGFPCDSLLAGESLAGFQEPGGPPAIRWEDLQSGERRVLLSSRAVVAAPLPPGWDDGATATLEIEGEVVGWVLPAGVPLPGVEALENPTAAPGTGRVLTLSGAALLQHPWDLIEGNPRRIALDLEMGGELQPVERLPPGVHVLGEGAFLMGEDVEVEPGVVLDLREGPIGLEAGVRVRSFTRIQGPSWFGPGCILQGGVFNHVGAGPRCRLRGEVEASVIQGWSNKAHDGYLGHAWLGSWVNLGAMTTNSDLKNNYGNVRLRTTGGVVDTGLMKLGCFLGDHVKTGIGTLLNTGTLIGAGSNVFGGAMPPTLVPPFSWGVGAELSTHRLESFLETATRAMGRRGVPLTDEMQGVLSRAFHGTSALRLMNPGDSAE